MTTTTTTDAPTDTHELASARVALFLQRNGWKQVDAAPWCWARGGDALPWWEALDATAAAPAKQDALGRLERLLHSKALMTVAPVVAGLVVDLVPVLVPAAQMLAPPIGTAVGAALGILGRTLAAHLQARRG
jgi:hypothetical protein